LTVKISKVLLTTQSMEASKKNRTLEISAIWIFSARLTLQSTWSQTGTLFKPRKRWAFQTPRSKTSRTCLAKMIVTMRASVPAWKSV